MRVHMAFIRWFKDVTLNDIPTVGGKNASLGQMIVDLSDRGVRVPNGFAVTAQAYWHHLEQNNLKELIAKTLAELTDYHDIAQLQKVASAVRALIMSKSMPADLAQEIVQAYEQLSDQYGSGECDVAVRSSATAEDLPNASFAGQQETFLNIRGPQAVLHACIRSFASLFTDRAIVYRIEQGFDHFQVGLSVGVQKMVRSDLASSGVAFSLDPETGFKDVITIESSFGLGETIVQGTVTPDQFIVHKPTLIKGFASLIKTKCGSKEVKAIYQDNLKSLESSQDTKDFENKLINQIITIKTTDIERSSLSLKTEQVLELARAVLVIEEQYSKIKGKWTPMDIEWGVDGLDHTLYILQARPETIHSGDTGKLSELSYSSYILKQVSNKTVSSSSKDPDFAQASSGFDAEAAAGSSRLQKQPISNQDQEKNKISNQDQNQASNQDQAQNQVSGTNNNHSPLVIGSSIGKKIVHGIARVIANASGINQVQEGDIIVTDMTDPDWVPAMKRAAGIVTNRGGRTCHAAIVSRELGIPAIVGAAGATECIKTGMKLTLDCSGGDRGFVYGGHVPFDVHTYALKNIPKPPVPLMLNIADPGSAFMYSGLPVSGVGLARLEFIINNEIGVHPMALINPDLVKDSAILEQIAQKIATNTLPVRPDVGTKKLRRSLGEDESAVSKGPDWFIDQLSQGIAVIAAAFYPRPVLVRLSDFKTNEYRQMLGGQAFEPYEENPMIGFRGASRYTHDLFKQAFALECAAIVHARDVFGLKNIRIMVPFVRTVQEAKDVIALLEQNNLVRNKSEKDGLEIWMMCEIPSNVLLIEQFAKLFDGFSIGSNDLTQLTLGVDRDSALVAPLFDERDEAAKKMFSLAISGANKAQVPIGVCGQAPSDYPELGQFFIECGISSISLNPDSVIPFLMRYES